MVLLYRFLLQNQWVPTVELTLGSQVDHATPVKVSYTDPTGSNDINAIQDTDGNDVADLNNRSVRNLRGFSTYSNNIQSTPWSTHQEFRNHSSFAALKEDGSVVTWGDPFSGGDSSSVSSSLSSGVTQIFSTESAFAVLKDDGSVVTWGGPSSGGDNSSVSSSLSSGVTQIFSSERAFAALKEDGSVVTWGQDKWSGTDNSLSVISTRPSNLSSGVSKIYSTGSAFAALKDDGSVVARDMPMDFDGDSSSVNAR